MNERFVLNKGDLSRLRKHLADAKAGKKVTVAFLGDSITAGSCAEVFSNRYTDQVKKHWEEMFGSNYEWVNAGIGATDSYLAVHRAGRDLFPHEPDIIFIEFINDADNDLYMASMDSLVRKCLSRPNAPAVILLEMTMEDGTCPQRAHSLAVRDYGVPMLSYHDVIMPEVLSGNIIWQDISPDNIHPNDKGHIMLGGLIADFLRSVSEDGSPAGEIKPFDRAAVPSPTGDLYADAVLAEKGSGLVTVIDAGGFTEDTGQEHFTDGWFAPNGASARFSAEFRRLGILYRMMTDGSYGKAEIAVDGKAVCTLDADFTGGWGSYARNEEVIHFPERGRHEITVTVPGNKGFELLAFMLS